MLESCTRPELVAEITLQPVRRYGVDAAILFSDIVLPLKAVGVDLDIKPGVGPVVAEPDPHARRPRPAAAARAATTWPSSPRRSRLLVARAGRDAADRLRRRAVHARVATSSRAVRRATTSSTKALMYGDPDALGRADAPARRHPATFLRVQVDGRRQRRAALRLVGGRAAARPTTARYVHAALGRACSRRSATLGVPRIHFGVGTGELLGADGRGRRRRGRRRLPGAAGRGRPAGRPGRALQGNLDPAVLFAPWEVVGRAHPRRAGGRPGGPRPRLQPRPRRASPTPTRTS